MFGGGKSMGGGAGGGMLRTVGRVVTTRTGVTNLQEPISSSSSSSSSSTTTANTTSPTSPTAASRQTQSRLSSPTHLSLSAVTSPFSAHKTPVSGVPTWPSFGSCCEDYEWVSLDGSEEEKSHGLLVDDFVLGPVPSPDEVNNAVSALQQVFDPVSYSQLVRDKFASNLDKDAEVDWIEPSLYLSNSRMLQPCGADRVYDAFHLLQTEPSIQRMVVSLSSDQAVWNAVLSNEVVRELKESYHAAEENGSESSDETSDDSNPALNIMKWIFSSTKARIMEVIDKITNIVNELFKPLVDEKATAGSATSGTKDPFEEKLRTSFLLSIVVLLVVVVSRASHRA